MNGVVVGELGAGQVDFLRELGDSEVAEGNGGGFLFGVSGRLRWV